jgi:hypothetical protein
VPIRVIRGSLASENSAFTLWVIFFHWLILSEPDHLHPIQDIRGESNCG